MDKDRNNKGQFLPGYVGARGKPKGSTNVATKMVKALGTKNAQAVVDKVLEQALAGDATCLKVLMDKMFPNVKSETLQFTLPKITRTQDLPLLTAALIQSVSEGKVAPDVAASLSKIIANHGQALEIHDQQNQLDELREIIIEPTIQK